VAVAEDVLLPLPDTGKPSSSLLWIAVVGIACVVFVVIIGLFVYVGFTNEKKSGSSPDYEEIQQGWVVDQPQKAPEALDGWEWEVQSSRGRQGTIPSANPTAGDKTPETDDLPGWYVEEPQGQMLTGVLRKGDPNFDWYNKYVTIDHESQKIQLGTNSAGDRIVMFSGTISNEGEAALDVVEVKLVLFNYGKPVWEAVGTPVRPDGGTQPIPPLGRRSFALYAETPPETWDSGQAEMRIKGFRFAAH